MSKAPKKRKMARKELDFKVEVLPEMIGKGRHDQSKCIRLSMTPDKVAKRDFDLFDLSPNDAYALKDQLDKVLKRVDNARDAYNKLDEIDSYLDSMRDTVSNAKDRLAEMDDDSDCAINDISNDLESDMRDMEESIKAL